MSKLSASQAKQIATVADQKNQQLRQFAVEEELEKILERIKYKARQGSFFLKIETVYSEIEGKLESLGYDVKSTHHLTPYHLIINWE